MANKKSSAEAYRERRKKQIARAAKKSSKRTSAQKRVIKIVVTVIAIVLAVGLVAFSVGNLMLNSFGTPQRHITVNKIDDYKITAAEYNYYYSSLYNDIWQFSQYYEQQYASYGEGMGAQLTGYDFNKSPSAQLYVGEDEFDELDENSTWADYFKISASRRAYISKYFYDEAMKNDYTLSDEEIKTIDDEIEEIRKTANDNSFSLKRYLTLLAGEGVNESLYRELKERDAIAMKYQTDLSEQYADLPTDEEIQNYYTENAEDYDSVYFRLFSVSYSAEESEDSDAYTQSRAKTIANNMLNEISTFEDFNDLAYKYAHSDDKKTYEYSDATAVKNMTYTSVSNDINLDLADWLFDEGRKVNDKTVIHDEDYSRYFVVCLEKTKALVDDLTVNVRHILVQFNNTDEEGNEIELTDEIVDVAKTEIDSIYNEWKDGEKTEDSFAKLAETRTDDPGSKETGGLYENVYRGQMVTEFEDWCYAPERKPGDTGIIRSSFGFHLMYFIDKNDEPHWKHSIRLALGSENFSEFVNSLYKKAYESESPNQRILDYFTARHLDNINRNYSSSTLATDTPAADSAE